MPEPLKSKLGPLPEDALDDEVLLDPDVDTKISSEMREWLNGLKKDRAPPPGRAE